ncbi:MAG: T9SS type A sorting domain-containing protein [Bacteroidales bacterium]|nr:T9SS type A sorting domain-containing protein [Bacteroidales bacterium]
MKKTFTLFIAIFLVSFLHGQTILAKWTFPTGSSSDLTAEVANSLNVDATLFTEGGTSAVELKNGLTTYAAQASGWENGQNSKSWQVELNTSGRGEITLSSVHTAGGTNPGPRDCKVQYRVGAEGAWTDIPEGSFSVANDWTTGEIDRLPLPIECENISSLFVRWVLTTNKDINGDDLISSGKAKIDNIIFESGVLLGNEALSKEMFKVYPNPCIDYLMIDSPINIVQVVIYNILGKIVYNTNIHETKHQISTNDFKNGIYIVTIKLENSEEIIAHKISIR